MSEQRQQKINVDQVVHYLSNAFASACDGNSSIGTKNTAGSKLHEFQVEFAYLINEIQRGPNYIVPKVIAETNEFIDRVKNYSE